MAWKSFLFVCRKKKLLGTSMMIVFTPAQPAGSRLCLQTPDVGEGKLCSHFVKSAHEATWSWRFNKLFVRIVQAIRVGMWKLDFTVERRKHTIGGERMKARKGHHTPPSGTMCFHIIFFYYACMRNRLFDGQWHPFRHVHSESDPTTKTQRAEWKCWTEVH